MAIDARAWARSSPYLLAAFFAIPIIGGCGGSGTSEPPASVSLAAPEPAGVAESDDRTVRVAVTLDPVPSTSVLAPLVFSGTATRDYDYAASTDVVIFPARTAAAWVDIHIFRDFEAEDDETITISLGEIEGNGQAGATTRVDLNIIDGGAANVDKAPGNQGFDAAIFPSHYVITEDSVNFGAFVFRPPSQDAAPARFIAEWSSDPNFSTGVNSLGVVDIPPFSPEMQIFPEPVVFSLPLSRLAPNATYFIRMYLNDPPEPTIEQPFGSAPRFAFATNALGKVITRCEAPVRAPGATGADPLFSQQWNLLNSGQSGFAASPGIPGADLRMQDAIRGGDNGDGVKLAVVDTGLEICHPDLAANIEAGKSFNFAFGISAGSARMDPFNHDIQGDHGTSVAGVAAAVANNGLGGRGVAPDVELRGFNLGANFAADTGLQLFNSLGASSSNPDSASADIFNMSFGYVVPSQNPEPDFVRLMQMGTSELRSGRGSLYVKAAGNAFSFCDSPHPLNAEVGCVGANADPDQNIPYLINVGAFNANDVKSSYSSAGANLWVVAPGGEDGVEHPAIITTDQFGVDAGYSRTRARLPDSRQLLSGDGDYISEFGGTSSAAPATAGAIAILLGVNPDLTWRDVKHILAASARRIDSDIEPVRAAFNGKPYIVQDAWQTNAAGYAYHNWYGFGAVSIDAAVTMAEIHTPDSLGEFVESAWFEASDIGASPLAVPDNDGAGVAHALQIMGLPNTANIEAVVLEIRVDHSFAFDLGVRLTSPSGTESIVNTPFNAILGEYPGLRDWQLMSNAFYGESPNGSWTVQVADLAEGDTGWLSAWRLRFYYGDHP